MSKKLATQQVPQKNKPVNAVRHLKTFFDLMFGQGDNRYDDAPDFMTDLRDCEEMRSLEPLKRVEKTYKKLKDVLDDLGKDIDKLHELNMTRFWYNKNAAVNGKSVSKYITKPTEGEHPKI